MATVLVRVGFAVTIFGSKDKLNGVMRYGTPEFRLPRTVLCRIARRLAEMNVKFRASTTIGGALEIGDLMRDGYGAVFVGAGIWRPRTLGTRGEPLANVHFAMDYLGNSDAFELGETVAVTDVGNSAMDVARTALRHGARRVRPYVRTCEVHASTEELYCAQLKGAEIVCGHRVVDLTGTAPVRGDGVRRGGGRAGDEPGARARAGRLDGRRHQPGPEE
ncbi:Glutamate synthase [NADPH] small chain [Collinsella intestinalis]|nr:Glutamate synthase [NADPH] small chain [Collinsella intestinalis]